MLRVWFLVEIVLISVNSSAYTNVIGLYGSSNNSKSDIRYFILKQAELCPYISLCTLQNTSDSLDLYYKSKTPCCTQCSCDEACEAKDTCCPDFKGAKSFGNLSTAKEHKPTEGRDFERCEKVQHGKLENNLGYYMIAVCPGNFTDEFIRVRCESTVDYSEMEDLRDHIPVTDIDTERTFKNRFCYLCHQDTSLSLETWEVWLNCSGNPSEILSTYGENKPLKFAKLLLKDEIFACNVAFKPSQRINNFIKIYPCVYVSSISTCESKHTDQNLERLCAEYSWPIRVMINYKIETYRNYACLLCNDKEFKESCANNAFSAQYSALFRSKRLETLSSGQMNQNSTKSTTRPSFRVGTIARTFKKDADIRDCPEGEILDIRKGLCRHVACPRYFYIEEGRCVPTFTKYNRLVYQFFLQVIIPNSVPDDKVTEIESALFSEVKRVFQTRIGNGLYGFSLWGIKGPSTLSVLSQTYFLLGMVNSNAFGGQYAEILFFLYKLVTQENHVRISFTTNGRERKNAYIRFRFTTFFNLGLDIYSKTYIVKGRRLETLYLLKEFRTKQRELINRRILAITQSDLCYRVELYSNGSEFQVLSKNHVSVTETKDLLQMSLYQKKKMAGYFKIFVCLNNAFRAIPNNLNYVFGEATEDSVEISDSKGTVLNIKEVIVTDLERSLVAVGGTLSVAGIVIVLRAMCAKCKQRNLGTENSNNIDSDLNETNVNFELKLSKINKNNKTEQTMDNIGDML